MLRVVIIDDEHFAREVLKDYLSKFVDVELIASLEDPLKLVGLLVNHKIDLLFLDIQMPQIRGTTLLEKLDNPPITIFTTAYPNFALEAFDLQVVDYLLKPFSFERFEKGLDKAKTFLAAASKSNISSEEDYFTFRSDREDHKIKKEEIVLIESQLEYVKLYTVDSRYMFVESLKKLEGILTEPDFLRVHNSYIIGTRYAKRLSGNMVKVLDKEVPVSRSKKKIVKQKLFDL